MVDRAEVTDELVNFSDWGSPAVLFFNLADTARTSVSVDILRYGADLLPSRGASLTLLAVLDVVQHARSKSTGFASEECLGGCALRYCVCFRGVFIRWERAHRKLRSPSFGVARSSYGAPAAMARPLQSQQKAIAIFPVAQDATRVNPES